MYTVKIITLLQYNGKCIIFIILVYYKILQFKNTYNWLKNKNKNRENQLINTINPNNVFSSSFHRN